MFAENENNNDSVAFSRQFTKHVIEALLETFWRFSMLTILLNEFVDFFQFKSKQKHRTKTQKPFDLNKNFECLVKD